MKAEYDQWEFLIEWCEARGIKYTLDEIEHGPFEIETIITVHDETEEIRTAMKLTFGLRNDDPNPECT